MQSLQDNAENVWPPMARRKIMRAAMIDGLPLSLEAPDAVLARIEDAITGRADGGYISITNTESMYHGLRRPRMATI